MSRTILNPRNSSRQFDQISNYSFHPFIINLPTCGTRLRRTRQHAVVPEFPRYLEQIKDFIANDVPTLNGFNGNDIARLLFSDLVNPSNLYTFLLLFSCAVAFLSFEAPELYDEIKEEKELEKLEESFRKESPQQAQDIETRDISLQNKIAEERKRGLAWLALITSIAIWCTGVVNKIDAFQP